MSHVQCLAPAMASKGMAVLESFNRRAGFDGLDLSNQDMFGAWHRTGPR